MSQPKDISSDQESEMAEESRLRLLDYNLSLTPEERLLNHQRALDTVNELLKARKQVYGELESYPQTTP